MATSPQKSQRSAEAIIKRRRSVAKYRKARLDQHEIAEILGVSQKTISRDIEWLEKEWRKEAIRDVGSIKARELAELDEMEKWIVAQILSQATEHKHKAIYMRLRIAIKQRRAKMMGLDEPEVIVIEDDELTKTPPVNTDQVVADAILGAAAEMGMDLAELGLDLKLPTVPAADTEADEEEDEPEDEDEEPDE